MTLPDGWILRVSRSKGKVFYVNTHTQQTQWTRPTEAAIAPLPDSNADEERHAPPKKRKREVTNSNPITTTDTVKGQSNAVAVAVGRDQRAAIARCMRAGASSAGKAFAPWEHQVDAVDKLLEALKQPLDPYGSRANRFLLQHSTGSGKTITIAALTHQLLYTRNASNRRFHTVMLLIDRIKLDEQVGDSVERFLRRNGMDAIYRATSIDHLARLLTPSNDTAPRQRVIISTTQKIGLLAKNKVLLTRLLQGNRTAPTTSEGNGEVFSRIAIITDEAHRSHTAATRQTIEAVMHASDETDEHPVTFVGFTATPNVEALRLFGSPSSDHDSLRPFHCYSMARAVADARIVDVLQHYTCVRCELELSIPTKVQEEMVEMHAMRTVVDAASDSMDVLKAKSAFMMEDFTRAREAWSRAKCMIVTRSRRDVVRYYELITTFVENKRSPWRVFAVFSGAVTTESTESVPSRSVTEQSLNLKHVTLASSDIVIVCDKLDTGYSDPLLACMYIDRYLRSSVQTVQLLSRLNRVHLDKRSVHIVDFANHAAQIGRHFMTFWHQATARCDGDGENLPNADWRTALAVVGSLIQTTDVDLDQPKQVVACVKTLVRTLDRDAFQQALDAVRLGVTAWTSMEDQELARVDETVSSLSYRHFRVLKSALESAIVSNEEAELRGEEVVSKMKTRVKRYEILSKGQVHLGELVLPSHADPATSDK